MTELAQRLARLSPAQRELLQKRLSKTRAPAAEPVAIVGMGCRFPGAPTLKSYWQLIREQRSAVSEIPPERWNIDEFFDPTGETPGKMSVRWAALVDNPDQFDPQFFGITPREAARMDPQQRLLLEVAWETMENALTPPDQLAGSRTGVFVGIGGTDYSKVCVPYDDYFEQVDAHMGTGNALSIAANRLSYIFDFHGPSAAVDTACSSASLAIHMAVESLRRGESDAALAGGVNMILTPETTLAFSKARMLSPEGVCRPFDARANGYVRGEGCGLVLLKRLADAQRDGDQILAVLAATSVNQDGRTSGISAPNGQSQIACIRGAMKQAGITPDDVDYIEAHGTGTPLGDPIEVQALGEIFRSSDASQRPCYMTSAKANVGHMETVSGVAGLIKVVLMMQHDEIVPQTHFEELNPHIDLSGTRLVIPTEPQPWARSERPRIAGVSSFGFGGTNTHMIVRSGAEVPAPAEPAPAEMPHLLKLSAKSESALEEQARQLAAFVSDEDVEVSDVCWSANTGRADFNYRAVISLRGKERQQLVERLEALGAGNTKGESGIKTNVVRALRRAQVAFLFTGQGSQYVGMGRKLYEAQPVFRETIEKCDKILRELWGGKSLLDILYPPDASASRDQPKLHQTRFTQPSLFALEYSLAQLWASWGVTPDVVLGHSVGEYAAACVAGVMSLEDGLALIAERARLMQSVERHGKMAVVFASAERVRQELAAADGEVVIAVLNGPENTVISGDAEAVDALAARFIAAGIQVTPLNVSHAFHSPLMDEMLDAFEAVAARIAYQAPRVPIAANLTGQLMTAAPDAQYWRDHLRNAVQFAEGVARVAEAEPQMIVEIGPTASLIGMARRCVPKLDAAWLPSMREGQDDLQILSNSVSEYYVRGGRIDWRGWGRPWAHRRVLLPTYPFQRSRQWYKLDAARRRSFSPNGAAAAALAVSGDGEVRHPLLGSRLSTVWSNSLFETRLSNRAPAYLADHEVQGSPVVPAAAYLEQGLAACESVLGPGRHGVANLVIQQAMFLPEGAGRRVQLSVAPEAGGEAAFEVYSRPIDADGSAPWAMHAAGSLVHASRLEAHEQPPRVDIEALRARAISTTERAEFYEFMAERGLKYGPSFQVLADLRRCESDAVARLELPAEVRREASQYHVHPALGDALLQLMAGVVPLEADGSFSPFTYMPVAIRSARKLAEIDFDAPLFVYAKRTSSDSEPSPEAVEANVYLVGASGEALVALEGVRVQRLGRSGSGDASADSARLTYRIQWQEQALARAEAAGVPRSGAWLILADAQGVGEALADRLAARGESSILVRPGDRLEVADAASGNGRAAHHARATVDPLDADQFRQLLESQFDARSRACLGVVHLWSLDVEPPAESGQPWTAAGRLGCGGTLQLVRAVSQSDLAKSPRLWLVTRGAQPVDEAGTLERLAVEQSPLVGFARVGAMELGDLRPTLVDLDSTVAADAAEVLLREFAGEADENEVAYRGGKRYLPRLVRDDSLAGESTSAPTASLAIPGGAFQLRITEAGSFDALRFVPFERKAPEAGQVELEVRATGLNFSDVLKALGLYPGIKDEIVPLGIEASGVVTAVGAGVDRFEVGDEVFGVVPYAFASHARTAEYALTKKPKSIDHEEACTIPVTFLTAYYGLVRLAQLAPGERVLIHAGAGGVGLAAIQIAQQIGAEIFATAGSDAKREFLRSLGVEHVYSSRNTDFAEQILADTRREGVDVVLNSLPGEAITKSLSILRAYGRFLEIGKTDIYQNRMIGLLPFQDNLSYFAIDLDRMLRQRPEYVRRLFAEVMEQFEGGHYKPLMLTGFATENTVDAFRYMSQRKNIGKVVVSIESRDSAGDEPGAPQAFRSDGSYLITGGTGALGLQLAEWIARQGGGTIVLLSRRGADPKAQASIERIEQMGARVVVLQGDVADRESLQRAIAQLPSAPLRGVFHVAGLLDDGILLDMSLAQLERPMGPKVAGAWNLHAATLSAPLDHFVMFSSAASILGSPGQANYAAGNAFLDALAHARRAEGRPALTVNWGPWAGSGMVAEAGRGAAVQSRGMGLLDPEVALEMLGRLLQAGVAQVAVMDAQWGDMLRLMGSRRPTMLGEVASEVESAESVAADERVDHVFRNELLQASDEARQSLVSNYIRQELARIMGVEASTLEVDQPLSAFGLDSLLALELKNNLESKLDFTLPMAKLMEGPSIASLSAETSRLLAADDGARPSSGGREAEAWSPLLALHGEGSRAPLVLLPGLGGDVRCYADLVQHLGGEQPVHAFRPRGVDQDLPPHRSITEMITDYVEALRALQPSGPYYLAGWSTGGIFAFALAEALEQHGEEIGLLALFDTPLPSIVATIDLNDDARFLYDLINYTNRFAGTSMTLDYDDLTARSADERFRQILDEARRQGIVPAETPESFVRRLIEVGKANVEVIQSYEPRALSTTVNLFVPAKKGGLAEVSGRHVSAEEDLGWSSEVGQKVQLREVPGDHFTMMVGASAQHLADALREQLSAGSLSASERTHSSAR